MEGQANGGIGTGVVDAGTAMANPLLNGGLGGETVPSSPEELLGTIGGENLEPESNGNNPLLNNIIDNVETGTELDEFQDLLGIQAGVFSGVDLNGFSDVLDFDTQESRESISKQVQALKDGGFNEEQIKYFVRSQIEIYNDAMEDAKHALMNEYEAEMTPAEIRANLEQNLTVEEKRNLKPMSQWVTSVISPEILTNDVLTNIFTDPTAIKIVNALYKQSLTNGVNRAIEPRQSPNVNKQSVQLTPQVAMDYYNEWLKTQPRVTREQTVEQVGKLRGYVNSDALGQFDELFSVLL